VVLPVKVVADISQVLLSVVLSLLQQLVDLRLLLRVFPKQMHRLGKLKVHLLLGSWGQRVFSVEGLVLSSECLWVYHLFALKYRRRTLFVQRIGLFLKVKRF